MHENRLEESDNSIMSMFSLGDYEKANYCSQQSIIHSNYLTAVPDATSTLAGKMLTKSGWLKTFLASQLQQKPQHILTFLKGALTKQNSYLKVNMFRHNMRNTKCTTTQVKIVMNE